MTESKIIHIIRTSSGDIMATARGLSTEAANSYRAANCEIFAFKIELPVHVAVEAVGTAKRIDG